MGLFERIGKWVDRKFAQVGRAISAIGRRITGLGESIEKKFAPEVPRRKKTWRDRVVEVVPEDEIDVGMTDEEIREKYHAENAD